MSVTEKVVVGDVERWPLLGRGGGGEVLYDIFLGSTTCFSCKEVFKKAYFENLISIG